MNFDEKSCWWFCVYSDHKYCYFSVQTIHNNDQIQIQIYLVLGLVAKSTINRGSFGENHFEARYIGAPTCLLSPRVSVKGRVAHSQKEKRGRKERVD